MDTLVVTLSARSPHGGITPIVETSDLEIVSDGV